MSAPARAGRRTPIVGGGGMGASIAAFLAAMDPSERIVVVERDPAYRRASSALSASSIRQQFSTPLSVELSRFGWTFMRGIAEAGGAPGSGVGLHERGYLFLAQPAQAAALERRAGMNRTLGVPLAVLSPEALAARWPWLRCDDLALGVLGEAGEGWFDGWLLLQHLRAQARAGGVEFRHGEALRLEARGSRIAAAVLADGSRIEADRIVVAAGPWSAPIAETAGVRLPVRPRRRTMFLVSCPTRLPGFPVLADASGAWARPEQRDFLVTVSPPPERDHDDLPLDPDFTLFEEIAWPALAARVPAFEALRVERAWAGYYEFNTVDHNGLVGPIGPDGLVVATGFSGHGLMHAPGIGRGVAEWLAHGAYRSLDLSPLSPRRIEAGRPIREDAVI